MGVAEGLDVEGDTEGATCVDVRGDWEAGSGGGRCGGAVDSSVGAPRPQASEASVGMRTCTGARARTPTLCTLARPLARATNTHNVTLARRRGKNAPRP